MQGYLIGNGVTDSSTDNINIFSLFSSWPLIPHTLAANLTQYDCGTLSNPIGDPCVFRMRHMGDSSPMLFDKVTSSAIDQVYNMYSVC